MYTTPNRPKLAVSVCVMIECACVHLCVCVHGVHVCGVCVYECACVGGVCTRCVCVYMHHYESVCRCVCMCTHTLTSSLLYTSSQTNSSTHPQFLSLSHLAHQPVVAGPFVLLHAPSTAPTSGVHCHRGNQTAVVSSLLFLIQAQTCTCFLDLLIPCLWGSGGEREVYIACIRRCVGLKGMVGV